MSQLEQQRTWFDDDWEVPKDTNERDQRVAKLVPDVDVLEPIVVEEWHQQQADSFVGHLIDDYSIDERHAKEIAHRVAYDFAVVAAMERSRKDRGSQLPANDGG